MRRPLQVLVLAGCAAVPALAQSQESVWREVLPTPGTFTPTTISQTTRPTGTFPWAEATGASTPQREDAETTTIAQLTFAAEGGAFDPSVSADGKTLIFASTQHRQTSDIYTQRLGGRALTRLTNDTADDVMPALSPDGSRIAFASNRSGNWDIYVMPVTGGAAVRITEDPADELHPSWSPTGEELVFCRQGETSGRWEMWTAQPAARGVARFIGYGMFPKWCPTPGTGSNGFDRIAFQLGRERGNRAFGIWTIEYRDGQTGAVTELDSSTERALINPSWSPDGMRVVYTSVPAESSTMASRPMDSELWMMDADGANRVRVAAGAHTALMPIWLNSNALAFVSDRSGVDNVWSIDMTSPMLAASHGASSTTRTASRTPTRHAGDEDPREGADQSHDEHAQPAQADAGHHADHE